MNVNYPTISTSGSAVTLNHGSSPTSVNIKIFLIGEIFVERDSAKVHIMDYPKELFCFIARKESFEYDISLEYLLYI